MENETKGLIQINIAILLLSMVGLFAKWIQLPATIIILGRVFFASLALLIILKISKQNLQLKSTKDLSYLIVMGILFGIHMVAFFESAQISTIAIAMISIYTFPVMITFIEPIVFKEKISKLNIVLALVALLGIVLIVPDFSGANNITKGVLWGLLAALSFSITAVMNRKYSQTYSSSVITFYECLVSGIILMPFLFIEHFIIQVNDLLLMVILGLVFTAIAYSLYTKGLKYVKAQKAGLIGTIEPVYSIIFAAALLGEIPELRTLIGATIVVGTAIFTQLKIRNN
ncbi:EamA family transporter [Candidatus Micrarchaeota archaeon]|nr:EamA family transporter [Candidatus Micrarchaeota archaeon]